MRLAIMKIGANITFSSNNASAANADILYFLRQINVDDHDITIITHRTRNTFIPKKIRFLEINTHPNLNEFDAVIVFNGSVNFFGGAMDPNLLAIYSALHECDIPIIYLQTDGALPFKQLWPLIWKREWAQDLNKEDYYIEPEQVCYMTQGRDMNALNQLILSKKELVQTTNLEHYPHARCILAKHEQYIKPNPIPFEDRKYELGFGGYVRNTYKRKRIEHYFNAEDNLLFGNLRGVRAPLARMQGKCSYQQFIKMMHQCKGTVIIGDEYYCDNYITLRFYECLLADCITFIDHRLDTYHYMYGEDNELYVVHPNGIYVDYRMYDIFQECKRNVFSFYNFEHAREELIGVIQQCQDQI